MHNNFLDKRRRNLRLQSSQVEMVLPEHFASSYPKFVNLLTYYYEFQSEEKATELLNHLFAARDITETDIQLLSFIEDELLLGDAYFESFATGDAQKRAAANFSNTLFRSKGTTFAIQWFFRSFFNIDVEVVKTKENIFVVGDPESRVGPNSLRFLTDDKLYQTFAYLIRSSIPFSKWGDLFKLFVHPAGMYLGAQLLISDEKLLELTSLDSDASVTTLTTPTYSLTSLGDSAEGSELTWTLTRSDGIDLDDHDWFISGLNGDKIYGSTKQVYSVLDYPMDSADFYSFDGIPFNAEDSAFPDVFNPRPLILNSGVGTVRIKPRLDDIDEGNTFSLPPFILPDSASGESYYLVFRDGERRVVAETIVGIGDIFSSYTISEDATTIDEGDAVTFSVSGTNVPNDGTTTLKYQVLPITTDSADFVSGTFPTAGTFLPLPISASSGQFTVQTRVDGLVGEGAETFNVKVYTESGVLKATSSTITVNNVTPRFDYGSPTAPDEVFSSSPGAGDILVTEGGQVQVRLAVDPTTVGEEVYYSIDAGDNRITTLSGTFTITAADEIYTLSGTEITDTYDSVISTYRLRTLSVDSGGFFTPILGNNDQLIQLGSLDPTFNVSADQAGLGEGDTVTFTVSGTNIPDGNSAKYYINHGTTDNADFTVAPPTSVGTAANLSFTSNSATQSFTFASNTDTDDTANEDFTFVVIDNNDTEVASLNYTILGQNTYSLTNPTSPVSENATVTTTFTTDDDDGVYYYWLEGSGPEILFSDDFISGFASNDARQSFTVIGGTADISVTLNEDQRREGVETFKILVSTGVSPSGAVAQTNDITINDTSLPIYSLSMANINEGQTLSTILTGDTENSTTEQVYVTFITTTGDSVTFGNDTPLPQTFVGGSTSSLTFSTTTSVQNEYTGGSVVTAYASIGNYINEGGTLVASTTATVADAASSYTLVTNKTNDSANEGDTITFTFGGTNVPSGTYYYRLSDIKPHLYGSTNYTNAIQGDTIYLPYYGSLSDLSVGMEVRGFDIENYFDSEATISLISDTTSTFTFDYIKMSENASGTLPYTAPKLAYFAFPQVWEDFVGAGAGGSGAPYGSFSHTTGTTSTFTLNVADTPDVVDPPTTSYTMIVASSPSGSALKTKTFTIYDGDVDPTPNVQIGTLTDPDSFVSIRINDDATCQIRFKSDGSIDVGNELIAVPFQYTSYGNWVDDTGVNFTNSEFEIYATKVPGTEIIDNGAIGGNFGVWSDLSTTRSWSADAYLDFNNVSSAEVTIDFIIREIADTSNVTTVRVTISAECEETGDR
jgi:hypothetical protein